MIKLPALLVIMILIVGIILPIAYSFPYGPSDPEVDSALNWLQSQQQISGEIGSFAVSSWAVMAITASGDDPNNWADGGDSVVQYLKNNVGLLSSSADYSRFILSMVAAQVDPTIINEVNVVALLESTFDGTQFGDSAVLNDDYFGVMALISAGISQDDPKIQSTMTFIKNNQNESGGWSYDVGGLWGCDPDMTGAAIMALISAGEPQDSSHILNGLSYLGSTQNSITGGLEGPWGSSVGSNSWGIQGIVAAGGDPTGPDWTTPSGMTPIDDLLSFQNPDGSFKDYSGNPSAWMTAYAIPAFLGVEFPISRGVRVDVRIEGISSQVWKGEVFVTWSNITDDTGEHHYYRNPTVIGTLDEASKKGGFPYLVNYGWGLAFVTDINGEVPSGPNGWLFRVNDHTTGSYSADQFVLNNVTLPLPPHTNVLWYWGGWSDNVTRIAASEMIVTEGESLTCTVTYYNENSETWLPLEGATAYADTVYVTNSTGHVDILLAEANTYLVYAEKEGYIRSDKIEVTVFSGSDDDSNLEVDILPALSLEVTPDSIDFGTMGPGDTSDPAEFYLRNNGSQDAIVRVTVTDHDSTVFQDCIQIWEDDSSGTWESWIYYEESIEGTNGMRIEQIRMNIPIDYSPPFIGVNEGTITFWLQAIEEN